MNKDLMYMKMTKILTMCAAMMLCGTIWAAAPVPGQNFDVLLRGTQPRVKAAADELTYQWYKDGERIYDATESSYTIEKVKKEDEGSYWVTISNGTDSVTSDEATLTVTEGLEISIQPQGGQAQKGKYFTFLVAPKGGNEDAYQFQWYKDGAPIAGATEGFYDINPVRESDEGTYWVIVSDGTDSVISDQVTLTVTDKARIWVKNVTSRYCSGEYGRNGRHVYFLENTPVPQFPASSDYLTFEVEVDGENGDLPDRILVDGEPVNLNGRTVKISEPIGIWDAGEYIMEIVAEDSETGEKSEPFLVNFDIIPAPSYPRFYPKSSVMPVTFHASQSQLVYESATEYMNLFGSIGGEKETYDFPEGILGKWSLNLKSSFGVEDKVYGDGSRTLGVRVGSPFKFKVGNKDAKGPSINFNGSIKQHYYPRSGEWFMDKSSISGSAGFSFSSPVDFRLPAMPILYGNISVNLKAKAALNFDTVSSYNYAGWTVSGNPLVEIQPSGGIGRSKGSHVALYGGVGLGGSYSQSTKKNSAGNEITENSGTISLTGRFGYEVKVLSLKKGADLIRGSVDIYRNGEWLPGFTWDSLAVKNVTAASDGFRYSDFQPIPRDYLTRVHAAASAPQTVKRTGGIETSLIQSGYPEPEPVLFRVGDKLYLLALRDDPSRDELNRTDLVLATSGANGADNWSGFVSIQNDGTADYMPAAAVMGDGSPVIVWANENKKLTANDGLESALQNLDITFAYMKSGSWKTYNLCENKVLDHSPMVAASGTSAWMAWIRNPSNDISGSASMPNSLVVRLFKGGKLSSEQVIANNIGMMGYADLAFNGKEGILIYSVDMDNDSSTSEDQELFACALKGDKWGQPQRLTTNATADVRPCAFYDAAGRLVLIWCRGDAIVTQTASSAEGLTLNNPVTLLNMEYEMGMQDFKLVRGDAGQMGLVWESRMLDDDDQESLASADPVMVYYDPASQSWSQPVRLLEDESVESLISGCFDAGGDLRLAYAKTGIVRGEDQIPMPGDTDLCVLRQSTSADLSIWASDVVLENEEPQAGETNKVTVTVRNLGILPANGLTVSLCQGTASSMGAAITSQRLTQPILGGGKATVEFNWTLPSNGSSVSYYVNASTTSAEASQANNSCKLLDMGADLRLDAVWAMVNDDTATIHIGVLNQGNSAYPAGAKVVLRRGSAAGSVIGEVTLPQIGVNENGYYEAIYQWNVGQLGTNEEEVCVQLVGGTGSGHADNYQTQFKIVIEPGSGDEGTDLSIRKGNRYVIVSFTGKLYESPNGVNHWSYVTDESPYMAEVTGSCKFYRAVTNGYGSGGNDDEDLIKEGENFTTPISDSVNLDMIWCPPGTFMMGSPENELGRKDDEVQHQVTRTQGYWLGKYEVTQAQYEAIMGGIPFAWQTEYSESPERIGDNLPVEYVDYSGAISFCNRLTEQEQSAGRLPEGYKYTLPTKEQWEYACRAGTTGDYNVDGAALSDLAWYSDNSGHKTHPVGQKKPNAWGLYDMHGNVWELDIDYYSGGIFDPSYAGKHGGDCNSSAANCRSSSYAVVLQHSPISTGYYDPDRFRGIGFRVALVPVQ